MDDDHDLCKQVDAALKCIWPDGDASILGYCKSMIVPFAQSGCQDKHYLQELGSGDKAKVAARIWEAMLYHRFHALQWTISSKEQGPDFLLNDKVYVEAVTASPGDPDKGGLPEKWVENDVGQAYVVPEDAMLTRLTQAIKTKKDKHLRDINCQMACSTKPFVLAVNSCQLGPDTHGIGGVPLVAMAVLPFGDLTMQENVKTGEVIKDWHLEWRANILKKGVPIPTDNFLSEEYSCVSAVIGCSGFTNTSMTESQHTKYHDQPPYFVIHNPMAKHPLPKPWLPGAIEYDVILNEKTVELACLSP